MLKPARFGIYIAGTLLGQILSCLDVTTRTRGGLYTHYSPSLHARASDRKASDGPKRNLWTSVAAAS